MLLIIIIIMKIAANLTGLFDIWSHILVVMIMASVDNDLQFFFYFGSSCDSDEYFTLDMIQNHAC